jgi:hypothetical protein
MSSTSRGGPRPVYGLQHRSQQQRQIAIASMLAGCSLLRAQVEGPNFFITPHYAPTIQP